MKDWQGKKIYELFNIETGTTPSTKEKEYWENGRRNWITPTDLSKVGNKVFISDSERNITDSALEKCNLTELPVDSLILSTRAPVGYVAIIKKPASFNQGCKGLVPKSGCKIDTTFYYYYLINIKHYLQSISGGSTFKELSKDLLSSIDVPYPEFKEQKAIAQILSTVDEGIQKADEAIKHTERLKQGLMQKLLTEGIGHSEFKETKIGRIPKGWEVLALERITVNITDGKHGDCTNEENSGYYFISAKDIIDGKINYKDARQITRKDFEEAHRRTKLEPNDILLTNSGSIGKTALVFGSNNTEKTTFQKSVAIIKPNQDVVISEFLLYIFFNVKKKLEYLSNGTSQKNLLLKDLRAFNVPIPSIQEQKVIIEIVKCVDKKLELEKQRKQKLVNIKKGLMNDLLTGKKRVKV